ncbi:lipopolysaccharide/colanic/teichoic acid biosynthesis glycosyltransferase [Spirosoma sp. LMG 31447]|uniref:Lipopolysaccharide/colanic/teichoic acid biosynthesis glycosyltransferase n=2 Tax=Spirosoma utsteinense TaxID=2585773 RepID=A0ABR6WC78_9BACT|nr:lipopolysaccharide/colanic/teichoic acid biosynthesis glycosyltransferase [Spirosoma utsteinense]
MAIMQAVKEVAQPFRVLYVESNNQLVESFQQAFSAQIEVTSVPDGQAALAYLKENRFVDLVLYNEDLGSSVFLNGLALSRHLPHVPVVLLTDRPGIDLKADPFHGHLIDAFPHNYAEDALRIRLSYLIQKKEYSQDGHVVHKSDSMRIPVGKRAFDIGLSLLILLMISPILLVVAILIKFDSKGPIFYSSKRVGTGFKIFDMYKFRTMKTGSDQLLASMASQNLYNTASEEKPADTRCETCQLANTTCQRPLYMDQQEICEVLYQREQNAKAMFSKFKEDPRVTRLGKVLRNTSIDELPQLFNILRGDMSFVGNRPLPVYEAEKLTTTGYARRFAAPAGLTGLWQVTKRGKASVSDQERIQLDVLYAKNFSLRTDLLILLKTLKAVWQKENV